MLFIISFFSLTNKSININILDTKVRWVVALFVLVAKLLYNYKYPPETIKDKIGVTNEHLSNKCFIR